MKQSSYVKHILTSLDVFRRLFDQLIYLWIWVIPFLEFPSSGLVKNKFYFYKVEVQINLHITFVFEYWQKATEIKNEESLQSLPHCPEI